RAEWWLGGGVDDNSSFVTTLGGARRFADIGGGMLSVVGGFAYRDRDGFSLPDGATDPSARDGLRTNSDLQHADGFAIIRWSNVLRRSIGLTISGFNAERGVPPKEHISAPRFWRYPYHRRWIAALSASTGSFQTPLGYGTFDVGVGYNGGKLKIDVFSDRTYTTVTGEERGDEKTWTQRARLTHSVGSATLSAAVTAADVRYEEILPPDAPADYRQKMLSAGAELSVPLGSRTALVGGLVYDRTTTPETGGRTPGQDPFDNAGWRAGLTHDLSTAWHLHASASQRSRFPALRELYSGALNRFMPNPDLEPETLLGLEAGFTVGGALGANSTGSLQVIGFHHRLEDAVVRITLPAPDRRFRRINRDRIESSGAELLGGFVFGSDRARAVTLTGDAMLQRIAIFDQTAAGEPQRHAENNPEARGTLELGVPLPLALRGIANSRYTGKQFCLNADTGNEMTLDSQVETDLAVERSFALGGRSGLRVLRALIAVDNVSDATVFDQCGLPQPGRTLRLMFSLR
ncbi:MAG TPA: TonB-dependent receptor, partial [Gemmatimonadaceae bacterium]|nr:TonB-dependent receptor [Gemmatimonadaceae bacterium]